MAEIADIMAAIDTLAYDDQRTIADALRTRHLGRMASGQRLRTSVRIQRSATEAWQRYRDIIRQMEGVDIATRCRKRDIIVSRWCAIAQMGEDGYSNTEISKASGWDHSTIHANRGRIEAALDYPAQYDDFVRLWRRFQHRLAV